MTRRWMLVALLAAVAIHAVELYQFSSFEFDKVNHVAATSSWLAGRGFTIPDVAPAGLPASVYRPLLGFLPGYALALAPLMRVTHDVWWSTYALDLAAQSLFLVAWAAILQAATGSWTPAVALLLTWTIVFSPIAGGTYSDLLALSLFSAAVATGTRATSPRAVVAWIGGLTSAVLMATACVVRYAYWPLIVVIPIAIVAARRDGAAWALAAAHAAVVGAAAAITAAFMQQTTGEAVFLTRWYPDHARGMYWSHLLTISPFPADALGLGRVYALLAKDRPTWMALTPAVLWCVSAPFAVVAIAYLVSRARRWIAGQLDRDETYFVAVGVLACAATIAMNVWLTLRLPAVSDGWTAGAEPRYYLPTLPFFGASVWLVALDAALRMPRVRAVAVALLLGAMIITVPVRAVRLKRYLVKNVETTWMSRGRREQAEVIFVAIRSVTSGGAPPLFVDDSPNWRRYVATMGGALVVKHAALAGCTGRDVADMRFLMTVPSTPSHSPVAGTSLGAAEGVEILSVVGSPCQPAMAAR